MHVKTFFDSIWKHKISIILFALFFSLFVSIVIYSIRANPSIKNTIKKYTTPKKTYREQELLQKMKTFAFRNGEPALARGITGGAKDYGGNTIKGVLADITTNPIPIKTKDGKEIAKSIMTFTIFYINDYNELEKIYLSAAIQFPDGSYYLISDNPIRLPNDTVNDEYYYDKIGTPVFALFRTNTTLGLETLKQQGKSKEELDAAKRIFSFIQTYESSWKEELDTLVLGGRKGALEFLFPIAYSDDSFRLEYQVFTIP